MFSSDNLIVKIPHSANHLGASAAVTEPTLPADQSSMIWIYLLEIYNSLDLSNKLELTMKMEDTLVWTE